MRVPVFVSTIVALCTGAFIASAEPALKTKDGEDLAFVIAIGALCDSQRAMQEYLDAHLALDANADDLPARARIEQLAASRECTIVSQEEDVVVKTVVLKVTGEVARITASGYRIVILKGEPVRVVTHGAIGDAIKPGTIYYALASADAFDLKTRGEAMKPDGTPI